MADALNPFADPPNSRGFKADELVNASGRLRLLRSETVSEEADSARREKEPIVRFAVQKQN